MTKSKAINVHFGCGLCAPDEWINFDSSPTLRLQRIPALGSFFQGHGLPNFPSNARWVDITRGLPLKSGEVDRIYCSHVLEHLSLYDFRLGIAEVRRLLKPNGTFRLVLPDLEFTINQYVDSTKVDRASDFLESTILGVKQRKRNIGSFLRDWLGGSKHLWMWDYAGIEHELRSVGFQKIRRAEFGDSGDPLFASVEDRGRWENSLGVECHI